MPVPGTFTTGSLVALTNNNVIVSPREVGPVTFIDQSTGKVYNPTEWREPPVTGRFRSSTTAPVWKVLRTPNGTVTLLTKWRDEQLRCGTRDRSGQLRTHHIDHGPDGGVIAEDYDFYGDLLACPQINRAT